MALIDKVRVIKLLLFALFMMVSMVTPAQSQVDWSIKAGIGMANIIGDNMGSPKVKLAYKLGIGLECPFDKIWSLQTGVSFVSKGKLSPRQPPPITNLPTVVSGIHSLVIIFF